MKKHVAYKLDQAKIIILWKIQSEVALDTLPYFGRQERRNKDERIDCEQSQNYGWQLFHNGVRTKAYWKISVSPVYNARSLSTTLPVEITLMRHPQRCFPDGSGF